MARDTPTPVHTNAYTVLALPNPAGKAVITAAEIRRAYRRALLRWHPDKAVSASSSSDTAAAAAAPNGAKKNRHGNGAREEEEEEEEKKKKKKKKKEAEAGYSVDDITAAYRTLADPQLRRALDLCLATHHSAQPLGASGRGPGERTWLSGLELVDLDDLVFEEGGKGSGAVWYKSCRCGSKRGFVVREAELEEALEENEGHGGKGGEVLVGCGGCSLWIRVGFGVVEG
ncbi:uncharacterized protein BDZ99DRAFT_304622 [Mytilinidion resinicola]|uniref:Diphthamide biosynthesis protein 4 n=1 Tax=Mytilinidion resinicola TaxID=574789 RepID=A0A6A6YML1_9PEZI|nr:uncharacterized protein BDZ99DRAFT_304622 [Mytilinidion resinicola]KAF2810116.1 hypothetical protein BDZ99DRAFT_304622 [Mytilinidion resinicola]